MAAASLWQSLNCFKGCPAGKVEGIICELAMQTHAWDHEQLNPIPETYTGA